MRSDRLSAGSFSVWLLGMERALDGEADRDVPCGGCTACCTSSQFIHIGPDEVDTLARIPAELRFPAPRLPEGHVVLGYDERGHCPMLVDDACSIYEHRPRACRVYDCRIFAATGVEVDGSQLKIAERASRWEFEFPTAADVAEYDALRRAALSIEGAANATQRAVRAIELHLGGTHQNS
jgi:Fe-S-cluster containining protein